MKWFEAWYGNLVGGDAMTQFSLHALLIVLAIAVLNYVLHRVLTRLGKVDTFWELVLVASARRPLFILAWVVGISFVGQIAQAQTGAAILSVFHPMRIIGVIVCLGWFLSSFIGNAKDAIIRRQTARGVEVDQTTAFAAVQLLRIAVWTTAILVGLQSLGFSIQGVLAFGGIGGIVIGFAAKDLLANFFGGLMIYFDRPFAVGEWVRSPDKQIEGTIEDIGWRLTRIRTFDKRPLYVPNSVFANITVENPSRMSHRRINEIIGLRYDDIGKVAAIVEDIHAMIRAHPEIDQEQPMVVSFDKFGDFSLDILIRALSHVTVGAEFQRVKQDILLKVAAIIASHGAKVALPTRVISQALPSVDNV